MAMNKTPGVTLMLEYVMPRQVKKGQTYSGNMDYINRDEVHTEKNDFIKFSDVFEELKEESVQRKNNFETKNNSSSYKNYLGYMDREQARENRKDGMFDVYRNQLTDKQRYFYEKKHDEAFEKNALLWRPIISFDNEWLREQGILEENMIHDEKIKQATRKAVKSLLEEKKLDVYWVGQIHYNTGNIHVHISMVEKEPKDIDTLENPKKHGILSISSADKAKSRVANHFMDRTHQQQKINHLLREQMVGAAKKRNFQKKYERRFEFLSQRLSTYHYAKLKPHEKKWIDDFTQSILKSQFKREYREFNHLIQQESQVYQRAYGIGERQLYEKYEKNRKQDLNYRLGNTVLSQIKEYRKEKIESHADEIKKSPVYKPNYSIYRLQSRLRKETRKALNEYEKMQKDLEKGSEFELER